jgi:hypothetical protein
MQLVANGPDIPDVLLQAQEDGRVVFFCGAGISYPAGLPGFKRLVEEIYGVVGTTRKPSEEAAYRRDQFDATLDLLERRLPGQRLAVREALAKVLQPDLSRSGATDTHEALLQLARSREGTTRLVTTNFDRIFVGLTAGRTPEVPSHSAPMLPIPKNSRWNGLVYLHGLLPDRPDEAALNRLVLTSGDFGLAYLTERWAARFVSELFRNYVVCFVGYSISDPVLRYMMDALAADRMLGEVTPQAFAMGAAETGNEAERTVEWEAKGVVPVLYEAGAEGADHSALHRTLKAWAEIYRDGILGKERIVVDYALSRPSTSTRQDDFVGRLLWALSDGSGAPAKRFADFDPVPSLDWLEAFAESRYRHRDLVRFGVAPLAQVDDQLGFSLVRRPSPYTHAPWMALLLDSATASGWDAVMSHLARWLVRHLDDPALILWLAKSGARLHGRLSWLIEDALERFAKLEAEGNRAELDRIRAQAPYAIPRPLLRTVWRLFLTGLVKVHSPNLDFVQWKNLLNLDGLTTTLRLQLRQLLAPKVGLRQPFRWPESAADSGAPERLKQFVDWEILLSADHVYPVSGLASVEAWRSALPSLLGDFEGLLRDALDLQRELEGASDYDDWSFFHLPSISQHWQNRGLREWVVLIELTRDAWLRTREVDPGRAVRTAQTWFSVPYPTFKRLALFAASHDGCTAPAMWVGWLLEDDAWWLWSTATLRETLRLLVLQGRQLVETAQGDLEAAILAGPPRRMYRDDIEPATWQELSDHSVWLRLAKLAFSGLDLGSTAAKRLATLSAANPAWQLATDERDEFSHWMSGTGDPEFESRRHIERAPRRRRELVEWLRQPLPKSLPPFYEDTWRDTCRDRFFASALALCDLALAEEWPVNRWRDAFQAWSEEAQIARSWRFIAPLVGTMPPETLQQVVDGLAWWLEAASKSIDRHHDLFLELCRRVLALSFEEPAEDDSIVGRAINHPIGHVTQALLNLWFSRQPGDNAGLPPDLEPTFRQLCDRRVGQFRYGRVLLASRAIALFRVDRGWSEANLLPLFDWSMGVTEARAAWEGFLWSPRLYSPLLVAFKRQFLETARHYAELGAHGQVFASFLTYAALEPASPYSNQEFAEALGALPAEALAESAQALAQAVEGAGEQREEYWINRIGPFWQAIWPKSLELASKEIAESLARLSIAAGGQFPSAVASVVNWLQPIEHPDYVVGLLSESGLSSRFPEDALRLLNAIIGNQRWAPRQLQQCLAAISEAAPELERDPRHERLTEYCRQRAAG